MAVVTNWVGATGDASLDDNWSNGVPDAAGEQNALFDENSVVDITSGFGSQRAYSTLTVTGNFSNGETVTVDAKTYTFVDPVAPTSDGEVDIGASAAVSLANLKAAINLSGTVGTEYGFGMTKHTTCVAAAITSTTLNIAYADAGTGGNGTTTTETCALASFGGATMTAGAASGATFLGDIYIEPGYSGDIHSSASKASLACDKIYHRGSGQICLDILATSRVCVDSPNYKLAMDIEQSSSLVALEIIQGRVKLNCDSALPERIIVSDTRNVLGRENLYMTGDASLTGGDLIIAAGRAQVDGPSWDDVEIGAGVFRILNGAITNLRSYGISYINSLDTITRAFVLGGTLDLTEGVGAKTVSVVWLAPGAKFERRDDIDTFVLREIGRN